MKRSIWMLLAIAFAVVPLLTIHFVTPSPGGLWQRVFYDSLHVPMFGLVAVGLFWITPGQWSGRRRFIVTIGTVLALGVLSEAAQIMTVRDASIRDLVSDVLGGAGFLFIAIAFSRSVSFSKRQRRHSVLLGVTLILLPLLPLMKISAAYVERVQMLPSLMRVDARFATVLFSTQGADLSPVRSNNGDRVAASLLLGNAPWPGIKLHDTWPNWDQYSALIIDIENPESDVLAITVRVDDMAHRRSNHYEDRFRRGFELKTGRHLLEIDLQEIREAPESRRMNLREIDNVIVFATRDEAGRRFLLHDIRLE